MECKGENLCLQLSDHDHEHFPAPFPPPPPQPSFKRKSPSQLRQKKRQREEALTKAEITAPEEEVKSQHSEKDKPEVLSLYHSEKDNAMKMTNSEEAKPLSNRD